ncbi:MAG: pyrroloquinoline quinone-dependent dehydrogenase, partial [Chitinophagaceae bacterium]
MFKNNLIWLIVSRALVLVLLIGCREKGTENVDWPKYLGDYEMSHYSTVSQINKDNVNQLEIAWQYNTRDTGDFQCNPIIVKSILYGISGAGSVFALNAKTGQENWKFIPSETKRFLKVRGVSYWENKNESRILCTYDEWLYALDAKTGKPIPSFGDNGRVTLRSGLGPNAEGRYLMSRTPGTVFEDLIVMPTVMMEGSGSAPGFIQAFNVISGKLEWVFHTIPLPGEFGFDT